MRSIVLASFLGIFAIACGKHDDRPATTSTAAPGSGAAPAPAGAPAPATAPADDVACKLITKAEAAKLLGKPVLDGEPHQTGPVPGCRFKADGAAGSLSLQYYVRGDANFGAVRSTMVKNPVDIAGAGTSAYRNADGSLVSVLANGHMAFVSAMSMGKNSGPTPAAAEEFAHVVAARL